MIYVVEFPHHTPPCAWFAFDSEDFARNVQARLTGSRTRFSAQSPRQQLEVMGPGQDSPHARADNPRIFQRAEAYGWDTVPYRADYLLGEGIYQTEPVTEFAACVAAIAHDLRTCRVYLSDQAATTALHRDPLYDGPEGFYAHRALREHLIALEVIADDL